MGVIRKDATITNTDDAFPGSFRVVLSAPTKDRDGDTLLADEWKQPLPEHITFDVDHEMSVRGTVGSGRPWLDHDNRFGAGKGALIVDGTYSSLQHAQDARTLVKEGHINRTSVAFMTEKTQKDGTSTVVRELLNGAFVAIPSNREAVVLESKGVKSGARNSKSDQEHIDALAGHLSEAARHAVALGATPAVGDPQGGDTAANPDVAAGKAFLPAAKDSDDDPLGQIAAIDAALDQAILLFASVDATTLPAEVQQAIALVTAAETTVDELMDALGIPDPDDDDDTAAAAEPTAASAAKAATAASDAPVTVEDATFDSQVQAARKRFYSTLTEGN